MHGTLVFDGECGFCTRARDLLARLDRHGRVETIAFQQRGALERAGVDPPELAKSVWWIDADGTRRRGAEAINAALAAATGLRLPLLVYLVPGIRQLQETVYRRVAANRHRFPGTTPWCRRHPGQCCAHSEAG